MSSTCFIYRTSTALKEHKKVEKNKRDKKNDRNKNFKNGPNIVKSSGVFSEGKICYIKNMWLFLRDY